MKNVLWLLLLVACGRDNALVDDECATGYVQQGDVCVLASLVDAGDGGPVGDGTTDGNPGDGNPSDGSRDHPLFRALGGRTV